MGDALDNYFIGKVGEGVPPSWRRERDRIWDMTTEELVRGTVQLGSDPEFWNDDDRFILENGDQPKWIVAPNTVVVHHTFTSPTIDYQQLNSMGLLRLYPPYFRYLAKKTGTPRPISSGHLEIFQPNATKARETYAGYHRFIREDGRVEEVLKLENTGWHAGNYNVNVHSVGVAFVRNLSNSYPTRASFESAAQVIAGLPMNSRENPMTIIGHREVPKPRGEPGFVDTICPGNRWDEWKPVLVGRVNELLDLRR